MKQRLVTLVLIVGLFVTVPALVGKLASWPWPGNQQGYEPIQPIAFSHRLHAGELQIACLYCHSGATHSKHAGIPASSVCMNCHKFVTATMGAILAEVEEAAQENRSPRPVVAPELKKLYDALGLDDKMQPVRPARPIPWIKVHNLPDFACFDHRAHVKAGVACQHCHGPIENMERVRQVESLSMGWCVNCHRQAAHQGLAGKKVKPSLDCSTCHY